MSKKNSPRLDPIAWTARERAFLSAYEFAREGRRERAPKAKRLRATLKDMRP